MARAALKSKKKEALPLSQQDVFRSFLEAEVEAILASMSKRDRADGDRCNTKAMEWIEKNAAKFRKAWYEALTICGESATANQAAAKSRANA